MGEESKPNVSPETLALVAELKALTGIKTNSDLLKFLMWAEPIIEVEKLQAELSALMPAVYRRFALKADISKAHPIRR